LFIHIDAHRGQVAVHQREALLGAACPTPDRQDDLPDDM